MHGPLHHRTPKLLTHWPASLSCPAWIGLVSGRCPLGNKEKKSSQPPQHNAPTPTLLATPLSPISVFSFHTAHRMDLPQAPQSLHTKTRRRAPLRYLFPPILASGVAMIVSQPSGPSNAQPCCCCGWCPVAGLTSVDSHDPPSILIPHLPLQCTSALQSAWIVVAGVPISGHWAVSTLEIRSIGQ
ncbi:hypothetical protein B0T09DRAFT_103509 [Sordaria sp. MPI-SDFR-AT-0083]|nr:hypothetical protein B0T09DRAFT_103509 [Sordaria sp. MPI-SDFR-AT-0083]